MFSLDATRRSISSNVLLLQLSPLETTCRLPSRATSKSTLTQIAARSAITDGQKYTRERPFSKLIADINENDALALF
jgi:hypothetical protein